MIIRNGKNGDIESIIILEKLANKEIKWWAQLTKKEIQALINKKMLYVAYDNNEIVGYLSGSTNKEKLILDNVLVIKSYRSNGIANKLIKMFITNNKRFRKIRLDCPERLRGFYEKLGFKVTALIMQRS